MPAEKRSLTRAIENLKRIANASTAGRSPDWKERMDQALIVVEQAIGRHNATLSDDKGCVVDVDSSLNPSPVVARRADDLHHDLDDLQHQVRTLRQLLPSVHLAPADIDSTTAAGALPVAPEAADLADFGVFCERLKHVIEGFEQFDEQEADLIQHSVTLDLGAGD
jgi:hypothetical protein